MFRTFLKLALALTMLVPNMALAQGATDPSKRVPMVNTKIERQELSDVLFRTHVKEFGTAPSMSRLAMGWAQVALENGNGKYSYNHNLGNIGPSRPDQLWYLSRLDGNFYESFDSFDDAAVRYWHVVKHCTGVLQRFDYGAGAEAAKLLRGCGYFGADLKAYSDGMVSLYWTGRKFARATVDKQVSELPNQDFGIRCVRTYTTAYL